MYPLPKMSYSQEVLRRGIWYSVTHCCSARLQESFGVGSPHKCPAGASTNRLSLARPNKRPLRSSSQQISRRAAVARFTPITENWLARSLTLVSATSLIVHQRAGRWYCTVLSSGAYQSHQRSAL